MTDHPPQGAASHRSRPLHYIVEHRWDGYNQRFSKIDTWSEVLKWTRDGSLQPGEEILAVYRLKRQPKIGKKK